MSVADSGLDFSVSPFAVLFTQEGTCVNSTSKGNQSFELVINVSENEFSAEECLDFPIDLAVLEGDSMGETGQSNADVIQSNLNITSACTSTSNGCGSNVGGSTFKGIDQAVSDKRSHASGSSDDGGCLEDHAKKGRYAFVKETEPVILAHPIKKHLEKSSNNITMVVSEVGLSSGEFSSTEDQLDSAEHELKLSEFCSLLCSNEVAKDCSSAECDTVADSNMNSQVLTALAEPTNVQLSTSPPCLSQNVLIKVTGAASSALPTVQIMNRLGPKLYPCERRVLRKPTHLGFVEGKILPDHGKSQGLKELPHSSCGAYESPQTDLSCSSEKPSNSQPVNSDFPTGLNTGAKANSQFSENTHAVSGPGFISNDPEENDDNNDPNWNYIYSLNTDDERYKTVRKRWKNLIIPNPNQDLTLQNYRKRLEVNGRVNVNVGICANNKRKICLIEPMEIVEPSAKRLRSSTDTCSSMFNAKINNVCADFRRKKQELEFRYQEQIRDYNATYCFSRNNALPNRFQSSENHTVYIRNLSDRYQQTLQNFEKECGNIVTKLQTSRDEIITVQKFYCGLKNSSNVSRNADVLSKHQVMEILEQEHMYSAYDTFYQ